MAFSFFQLRGTQPEIINLAAHSNQSCYRYDAQKEENLRFFFKILKIFPRIAEFQLKTAVSDHNKTAKTVLVWWAPSPAGPAMLGLLSALVSCLLILSQLLYNNRRKERNLRNQPPNPGLC
ncbi:MAG: hypothetical protein ACYTEX_22930, partial [Planctomycetota bacterium]